MDYLGRRALLALPRLLGLDLDLAQGLRRQLAPLDMQSLLDVATRQTGLADFGDEGFRTGLGILLESYEADAGLNTIGRLAARADVLRILKTRLRLEDDRKRFPEIAHEAIVKPIFITGLPRSGTTLLHNLLAQDPDSRVPLTWEVMFPTPPPAHDTHDRDPRIAEAGASLAWLDCLAPGFRRIHPVDAGLAQECIEITTYAFESPRFHTTHNAVAYQTWLAGCDQRAAYAYHRRVLQQLQCRFPARRWVLKAPSHLFALEALVETYPDACIIQTHRDPLEVLPSTASLTAALRRAFSNTVDLAEIGTEVVQRWAEGLRRAAEFRTTHTLRTPACDVWYADLLCDPIAEVQRIYRHFDLELTAPLEAAMRRYLAANPQHKHGTHDYALNEFGLAPNQVKSQFHAYYDRMFSSRNAGMPMARQS